VKQEGDMLLVADTAPRDGLGRYVREGRLIRIGDPYEALMEMGRRRWEGVLVTAPRADFSGLCRASRRLQPDSSLYAICPAPLEPEVRPLVGQVLSDYFVHPITRDDLEKIFAAVREGAPSLAEGAKVAHPAPEVLAQLLDATRNVPELESTVTHLISRRIGADVTWADADKISPGSRVLLLIPGENPRALLGNESRGELTDDEREFLAGLQKVLPSLISITERTETLHRLAITDSLTGAYNRRYFYHLTDQVLRRADRKNFRVTLLLYDIDNFKHYNDTYGYSAGDDILRDTAKLMKRATRKHDIVARIGGDEFAVLFWDKQQPRHPDSNPPESPVILADRFRQAVNKLNFHSLGSEATGVLTISGGLASFPVDGRTCRELLRSAGEALRQAKGSGKNAIRLVGSD